MKNNERTILVIDDDIDILDALKIILEYEGYKVKVSEKAEYVDNLLHENNSLPHLIILDVLLSGRDGRAICKQLKTQQKTKHVPIIMISAHPNIDRSIQEAGADGFLAKPFDMNSLLEKIEGVLSKRHNAH